LLNFCLCEYVDYIYPTIETFQIHPLHVIQQKSLNIQIDEYFPKVIITGTSCSYNVLSAVNNLVGKILKCKVTPDYHSG